VSRWSIRISKHWSKDCSPATDRLHLHQRRIHAEKKCAMAGEGIEQRSKRSGKKIRGGKSIVLLKARLIPRKMPLKNPQSPKDAAKPTIGK